MTLNPFSHPFLCHPLVLKPCFWIMVKPLDEDKSGMEKREAVLVTLVFDNRYVILRGLAQGLLFCRMV